MRIFLTGGTGFIGHHVAKKFLENGHELHIAARNLNKILSLLNTPKVKMFQAALNAPDDLKKAAEGCDACVHIALGWGTTPLSMLENDTRATVALLEIAKEAGCSKFIYTSSTAAMGAVHPKMDEGSANMPTDLYGATKAAGEAFVLGFRESSMKRNIIRPGYTFGNPAFSDGCVEPDRRFANIALAAKENKDISIIRNDGTQFISAENQAEVFARVLESDCDEEIFLALGSRWISWKQIAECAISLVPGCTSKIIEKDLGWGETPMLYSVRKIEDNFGLRFDALPDIEPHLKYYMDK